MSYTKFYTGQLELLVGATIVAPIISLNEYGGDDFFGLKLHKNGKDFALWFLRDDEGNGPGSFEIQSLEED